MKKVTVLVFSFLLVGFLSKAETSSMVQSFNNNYDGSSYIFMEDGVEFSVFPDGQFDFVYLGYDRRGNINIDRRGVNINFNSGYDYDVYVQYDDYGAVIQVENVEIYYDEYGRIIQAGNTEIHYNDRRIVQVGGLRVFYNHHGYFSHYTGYINIWTPYYIYRPWHIYYVRPFYSSCIVYDHPYRLYYKPFRYSYNDHRHYYKNRHRHSYRNARRDFFIPGSRIHHRDGRIVKRTDFDPRRENSFATANPRRHDKGLKERTSMRNSNGVKISKNRSGIKRKSNARIQTRPVANNSVSSTRGLDNDTFRSKDISRITKIKKSNSRPDRSRRSSSVVQNERPNINNHKKNITPSHRTIDNTRKKSSKSSIRNSSGQRGKR